MGVASIGERPDWTEIAELARGSRHDTLSPQFMALYDFQEPDLD